MTETAPARQYQKVGFGLGPTAFYACQFDQRFSFCLYVPTSYRADRTAPYPLVVIVHGTNRPAMEYRDRFAAFAERHECVVLAPLFPCGIYEPHEIHNYKFIAWHDIRFDQVLLAMVDEVAAVYHVDRARFLLHGFSGGGQFAHRFFYLHPERLRAVSIGAPGVVTLLDEERDWWVGVRNLEAVFGRSLDYAAMRQVAVQMVIGGDDVDNWDIIMTPDSPLWRAYWMPGANDAGQTRVERLAALRASFERAGIAVRYDVVPGVAHEGFKVIGAVQDFFGQVLAAERAGAA
ncbi:MAG: PHB depolymerase family esterase [Sphaerobacter sp.]|nr:PHB depolymerase family esterase [Sphaerobacter sp.]